MKYYGARIEHRIDGKAYVSWRCCPRGHYDYHIIEEDGETIEVTPYVSL